MKTYVRLSRLVVESPEFLLGSDWSSIQKKKTEKSTTVFHAKYKRRLSSFVLEKVDVEVCVGTIFLHLYKRQSNFRA